VEIYCSSHSQFFFRFSFRKMTLAVLQFRATSDVASNIIRASKLVRQAAMETKASFICLPEAFDYIVDFQAPLEHRPQPELVYGGERVKTFLDLAKELKIWISLGGIHELSHERSAQGIMKQYNSHVIVDDKGSIRAIYRKIHLFDAKVEGGYQESATVVPGDKLVVVKDTPIGTVGLSTCYDLRFPAMFSAMRDAGADVILVPSAFTKTTGIAHWHTLLRARAIENQVYVAAAAQIGVHNSVRASFGHSLVVDPFGSIVIDLGNESEDLMGAWEISKATIEAVRLQMPVQEHRHKADLVITFKTDKLEVV
jgi:predicted amidohydrolase